MLNNLRKNTCESGDSRRRNVQSRSSQGNEVVMGTERDFQDWEVPPRKRDIGWFLFLTHRKFPRPFTPALMSHIYNPMTLMRNKRFHK